MPALATVCPRGHDKGGKSRCYVCWKARKMEYNAKVRARELERLNRYPQVVPELARKVWLTWN